MHKNFQFLFFFDASLIFGKCEEEGIRCCYHGWLFAPDGEMLETPGEETDSTAAKNIRGRLRLGAYPVIEFNGLVFAYMGPPDEMPDFPLYDSFSLSGITTRPYRIDYNCNWLQILDAIMDPIHTSFLHSTISGAQFSEGLGEIGELEIHERGIQFLGSNTRRVNEHVWVRVNELILPNFTQAGAAFAADGTKTRFFGRSSFTRWVVPVDDTHSMALAWGNFGERGDPLEYNNQEGCELIEQGEVIDRSWEEKQLHPSDAEAVEGMGPISHHKNEHLMPTDQGILLYRRQIRKLVQDLNNGKKMPQPQQVPGEAVRTNGQDTVLYMPQKNKSDREFLRSVGLKVLQIQFEAEKMSSFSIEGEIAQVMPNPNSINNPETGDPNGVAFIDDFEGSKRTTSPSIQRRFWKASSAPIYYDDIMASFEDEYSQRNRGRTPLSR